MKETRVVSFGLFLTKRFHWSPVGNKQFAAPSPDGATSVLCFGSRSFYLSFYTTLSLKGFFYPLSLSLSLSLSPSL